MNYLIIAFIVFSNSLYAKETFRSALLTIRNESINKSPIEVHKAILKIKSKMESRLKELIETDEYDMNDLMYTSDLEILLENYPDKIEKVPSCEQLKIILMDADKTTWEDVPTAIDDIWPLIKKTCKK